MCVICVFVRAFFCLDKEINYEFYSSFFEYQGACLAF